MSTAGVMGFSGNLIEMLCVGWEHERSSFGICSLPSLLVPGKEALGPSQDISQEAGGKTLPSVIRLHGGRYETTLKRSQPGCPSCVAAVLAPLPACSRWVNDAQTPFWR